MKITDVLLTLVVTLLWGFNFVTIKAGLESFPDLTACCLVLVGLIFMVYGVKILKIITGAA